MSNFSGKKLPPPTVPPYQKPTPFPPSATKPGDAVYVFLSADKTSVKSLGTGTLISYEGKSGHKCQCPRIQLDQGGLVFGCDVYFGPLKGHEKFLQGREIVSVATVVDEATGYATFLSYSSHPKAH